MGPKQMKVTASRKKLIMKVAEKTGMHPADIQDAPAKELKHYLGLADKRRKARRRTSA